MFNSVCGEQQPHPARHEAGTEKTRAPNIQAPQGTGPPGEPPQGQPRPPPRKGQRRARRRDLRQPQCRRPRVPWRQARRLHRQPTTRADRALGPETQRPPTPQSGPSKASRARPRQSTAESGPALARASCPGARNHQRTGGILHRQGMVVGWGSTKMMSEAESKARPDT